ncbi:uncharacterized protein LOC143997811 isoform X1 [Lithobates pipiens]
MRTLLILGILVVCVLLVDGGGEKSMDSGDLAVPARLSKRNVKELPCCGLRRGPSCRYCPGKISFARPPSRGISTDDQKSMDSRDLTVPARLSRSLKEKTENLPCCGWRRKDSCRSCPGGNTYFGPPSHDKTAGVEDLKQ